MIVDAVAALIIGRAYDRFKARSGKKSGGLLTLAVIPALTILIPLLTLGSDPALAAAGMALYGIVLGGHETVMRSAIADLTSFHKRGTAYGIFNTVYGLALFLGSSLMACCMTPSRRRPSAPLSLWRRLWPFWCSCGSAGRSPPDRRAESSSFLTAKKDGQTVLFFIPGSAAGIPAPTPPPSHRRLRPPPPHHRGRHLRPGPERRSPVQPTRRESPASG